jgi:hypothetical protein
MTRSVLLISAFTIAQLISYTVVAADPERRHSFKFTLVSELAMDVAGQKQKIEADTDLRYTWKQNGEERVLSFDSSRVKANADGKEMLAFYMSREKFATRQEGKTEVVPLDKATPELKRALEDSYGVPLCVVHVDNDGKEFKRDIVAKPGAKDVIDQGLIANAMLFHPPFLTSEKEWTAPAEISMGNGGFAKGDLKYQKAAAEERGQKVIVTGTLSNDGSRPPNSPVSMRVAKYVVHGEQTYDPGKREWVAGKLTMDVSYKMEFDGNPVGGAKGTIVANLNELPPQK